MAEHAHAAAPVITVRKTIEDATRRVVSTGAQFATLDIALGILAAIGLIALVLNLIIEGVNDLEPWGYTAIVGGYLLSSVLSAPILAVLLRLTRSDWRRPLSRIAEIQAAAGIVVFILYLPLFFVFPRPRAASRSGLTGPGARRASSRRSCSGCSCLAATRSSISQPSRISPSCVTAAATTCRASSATRS